jgi:hypothetical protein
VVIKQFFNIIALEFAELSTNAKLAFLYKDFARLIKSAVPAAAFVGSFTAF